MTNACSVVDGKAKEGGRELTGSIPQGVRLAAKILEVAQSVWRGDRSLHKRIANAAKVSPRSIEYWSGGRGISADALANLIRSEEGFRFLEAVMDGHAPKWWRLCLAMQGVAEAHEMQAAARRQIRRAVQGAINADADITASIARAESALVLQDPDFGGTQFDGYRASAGASHRSMAQASKRGGR